jgi:plasmid stability protein
VHSTEVEVSHILALAVNPESRVLLGDALSALVRKIHLTNDDFEKRSQVGGKTPAVPLRFDRTF